MRKLVRFFTKIPVLEIADSAVPRIRELLETNSKSYLKIGIRKRGCNGKTYTMNYANEKDIGKFDEIVEQVVLGIRCYWYKARILLRCRSSKPLHLLPARARILQIISIDFRIHGMLVPL